LFVLRHSNVAHIETHPLTVAQCACQHVCIVCLKAAEALLTCKVTLKPIDANLTWSSQKYMKIRTYLLRRLYIFRVRGVACHS
jgi:hypothetical protein